jgi:broad specificity phosphatase PhoE
MTVPVSPSLDEATRIYLVRHGRTKLNAAGVLRGHLDPPLDVVGRRQVRELGVALAQRGIQSSSPARCGERLKRPRRSPDRLD